MKTSTYTISTIAAMILTSSFACLGQVNSSSDDHYRRLSTLTSGPSYKYNITTFISNYLPVNSVQLSDKSAMQMNTEAINLSNSSADLDARAKQLRAQLKDEISKSDIRITVRLADSLETLSSADNLQATTGLVNSYSRQFEVNYAKLSEMQLNANISTDELTLANLLTREAGIFYDRSSTEIEKANSASTQYVKQSYFEMAQHDLSAALLKQQSALNVYLSLKNGSSLAVAMKIDSMLTPKQRSMPDGGLIIFSVQVGAFKGNVPADRAEKLLKLASLGLTKHTEKDGTTVFTIGEYTDYTCADLLSEELVEDGFKDADVVTYTGTGKDAKPFEGIALK